MRNKFTALLSLLSVAALAQDTLVWRSRQDKVETGLLAGYRTEVAREDHAPMHMATIGVAQAVYGGRHGITASRYASVDFGMRGETPILGPRAGVQVSMLLSFGLDLAYYTDLEEGTLHFIPNFGVGGYPLRIAIEPHLRLVNTGFRPVDRGCVSITYRFVTLRRRILSPTAH